MSNDELPNLGSHCRHLLQIRWLGYSHPCLSNVSDETANAKSKDCHQHASFQRSDGYVRLLKANPALKPNMAKLPKEDYAHADDK